MPNEANRNPQQNQQSRDQFNPNQDIRKDKPMAKEAQEKDRKRQDNDADANFRQENQQKRTPEKRSGSGY